ncbi:MAG: translation initiation factor IF-2, partial [Thermoguttaceae bacterium]
PALEPEQVELAPAGSLEDTATATVAPRMGTAVEATVVAPVVPDVSVHITHARTPVEVPSEESRAIEIGVKEMPTAAAIPAAGEAAAEERSAGTASDASQAGSIPPDMGGAIQEAPIVDALAPAGPPAHAMPPLGRISPMRPMVSRRAPPVLKPSAKRPSGPRTPLRPGPAVRLAPIPAAKGPAAPKKPSEPAPQKPDLKLPLDAIRASKAGGKPLSEHLKKQEQKRKAALQPKKAGAAKERTKEELAADELLKDKRRGGRGAGDTEEGSGGSALLGREQRQLKRKRTTGVRGPGSEEEEVRPVSRPRFRAKRSGTSTAAPRKSHVVVELPVTVRSFSEALGVPATQVMSKLMELGAPAIITASIDRETAELLAVALGVEADFRQPVSPEEKLLAKFNREDDLEKLRPRPPIVTFLGHVDHGKTSLLDRILGLDVAAHEKGGITQHIRAYRVQKDVRSIAFVDTPGHEAFTAMRARGAMVTDIAVLVVAADDGVMPQTQEALSHARAAGVPIVVALNKVDLPGVNLDRIMQELATNGLLPSQWGGDTEVVQTSAVTGQGIDELLETLLTVAELHEYRADPDRPATGVCLEAEVQQGRGVIAKVLVQKGTLRLGDVLVCGSAHGRVKAMYDTLNPYKKYKEAGPSTPVNLTGLDMAPGAGDRCYVVDDIGEARQIAQDRAMANRQKELGGGQQHITLEDLARRLQEQQEVQDLNIILRADVRGSIEAIQKELTKLQHAEVKIKILQAMVGGVTEADVHLADASDAVIIGFNVVPDEKARMLAEQLGVQVRRYDIIYQVTGDLRAAMEGMLKPEKREMDLGRALVKRTFHISRLGTVAGCQVLAGTVQRDGRVRVIRESRIVGDYSLESLKREKDDAREVRQGFECGIKLGGFDDLKEGDILEAYKIEEVRRTL